ncbi:MAG: threonine synthase, partial [Desulfobacteraceae bacterium]
MNFFSHLECGMCGTIYDADRLWNLCPQCQKPLLARYDLAKAREHFKPEMLKQRAPNMWRYQELLPVRDPAKILCLGEGFTPLHPARRLGRELNFANLYIKDEGLNPTCSFKARGLSAAVSRAVELGVRTASIPSAGNAGNALAAYAALAGIKAHIFMPRDVPKPFINECKVLGAEVTLIDGLITDCGKVAAEGVKKYNRFDFSTLKEPYRLEGKKTMGYELAEQMHWTLPDVVIYPTGGGTGLVGMWKAFAEMETLGWIGPQRPRMVVVQAEGCAPMVKAFQEGQEFAPLWQGAKTLADGMRVPAAVGDFLIMRAVRESQGTALAVSDAEILESAA